MNQVVIMKVNLKMGKDMALENMNFQMAIPTMVSG